MPEPPRADEEAVAGERAPGGSVRDLLRQPEVLAVLGMIVLIRFANFAPNPVLPLFIQQLAADQTRLATIAGLVVASTGVASTISALLMGQAADRFGRRPTLLACLLVGGVLCLPYAAVTSVWQLLLLRTATGLALGGMMPVVQAIFSEVTPPNRRGVAFGIRAWF